MPKKSVTVLSHTRRKPVRAPSAPAREPLADNAFTGDTAQFDVASAGHASSIDGVNHLKAAVGLLRRKV